MKTVLLVEDDFDTINPLAELLQLRGFTAYTASDIQSAFSIASRLKPDLVITDIVLPGDTGLTLIKQIRADPAISGTPIMVISGCDETRLAEAHMAGATVCLRKPIDPPRFWEVFETVIGGGPDVVAVAAGEAQPAAEIEWLIQRVRASGSQEERQDYLVRLKSRILEAREP